ncbi:MAG: cyclic dehypoxanthinyl futalosine synthase [Candidatus Saccharibacteria bacterium]
MSIKPILGEITDGRRMTDAEFLSLYSEAELLNLAEASTAVRDRMFPEGLITFIIDRNINYTNICVCGCKFCAFYRPPGHEQGYVLGWPEIRKKIQEAVDAGATQVMIQGGLHPDLKIDYFADMFKNIRSDFPQIVIHSLTAPEVTHIAKISGLTTFETLKQLKNAGMASLPGGGAEVLDDRVREAISPNKINTKQWLKVMEEAHQLGIETTATMMLGSVDKIEERLGHLSRLRQLQDKTGGFRAFIMWAYNPGNNELMGKKIGTLEYLRMLALSRLYLDNFKHIQGSWVTQGRAVGQVSLLFGADDLGSTMLEENVVRATGLENRMSVESMVNIIQDAGKTAALRDTEYKILKVF